MGQWKNLALFSGLAAGAALVKKQEAPGEYPNYSLLEGCPGYKALKVEKHGSGLTANLELAGEACNAYGDDLKDLILEVTYESGEFCSAHVLLSGCN